MTTAVTCFSIVLLFVTLRATSSLPHFNSRFYPLVFSAATTLPRGGAFSFGGPTDRLDPDVGDGGDFGKGKASRRRLILGALGALSTIPIAAEAYSRRLYDTRAGKGIEDRDLLIRPEGGWERLEEMTVVFHGAGGPDGYTDELLAALRKETEQGREGVCHMQMVNWTDWSGNLLQSSFDGQRVGKRVASDLKAMAPRLKSLHAIGISVGGFAADACVREMKGPLSFTSPPSSSSHDDLDDTGRDGVFCQLTLLDPFAQRGVLDPGYGNREFGRSADYAQMVLNTDDPVPSTNRPLRHCAVTDVTPLRPPEVFGHDWPLIYFSRSGRVGLVGKTDQKDRGTVLVASS